MKKLVVELSNNLDSLKNQTGKAEEVLFVKNERKEISMFSLSDTTTKHQRAQVYALAKFLKDNEELTQDELDKILKARFFKFAFLRKLNNEIQDLIQELKKHGPSTVLMRYHQFKMVDKYEKEFKY